MARVLGAISLAVTLGACTGNRVGEVGSTAGGAAGTSGSGGLSGSTSGGSGGAAGSSKSDAGSDADVPDGVRVLADHRDCPADLEVEGGEVIWVDQGSLQNSAKDGVVATMPAAGCDDDAGSCISVLASAQHSPSALEVRNQIVYFATVGNDSIWYLDGVGSAPQLFATGQNFTRSIDSDETALFWVNAGAFGAGDGELRRSWLDEPGTNGLAIVPGLESPVALALFDSTVFWTNYGINDTDGRVMRADITGVASGSIAINQSAPRGIATSSAYVYWANSEDGTIMRSTPDGSVVAPLILGLSTPSDVAVDTNGIYWVEAGTPNLYADGSVKAAKLDGTGIVTLADNQRDPRRIVLSADHVFWINRGTQGLSPCTQHDGQIVRSPKPW
jgi:hypothetical protein